MPDGVASVAMDAFVLDPKSGRQVPMAELRAGQPPVDWQISQEPDGTVHAIGSPCMSVQAGGRAFKRRAIHMAIGPNGKSGQDCWLVGELDGVRCYVRDGHIVLTREDLNP